MATARRDEPEAEQEADDLRAFLVGALRPALYMLIHWIERRYGLAAPRERRDIDGRRRNV